MSFYLVGSRFFGTHREDSDYDFIAENTPENHEACLRLGLRKLDSKHVRYWGHGIDVCLVHNLDLHIKARDEVAKLDNVASMSKYERLSKLMEIINGLRLGQPV